MPKINVYLPDDLAEAVKESGVPVSAICQRALEQAVRRVNTIREAVLGEARAEELAARLPNFTERTRTTLRLAVRQARDQGAREAGTEHLLGGLIAEGGNLALQVLGVLEISPDQVTRALAAKAPARDVAGDEGLRFSGPAANALELTATEAIGMQHNYIGCEHLLIALAQEPDGTAGGVLRDLGADARAVRRAVTAAVAGYAHLRAQKPAADPQAALAAAVRKEIEPLVRRIERLEASAEKKA
jgi:ATP-dependent Clp protease ATP-binding subunit ClpA/post-segregation antitoxin (ccd killing protein)